MGTAIASHVVEDSEVIGYGAPRVGVEVTVAGEGMSQLHGPNPHLLEHHEARPESWTIGRACPRPAQHDDRRSVETLVAQRIGPIRERVDGDVDLILFDDGKNDPFEIRPSVRRGVDVSPKGHISALGVGVKVDPAFDLSGPVRWHGVHAGANYRNEGDGLLANPGHRPPSHRSRTSVSHGQSNPMVSKRGVKVSELLELWLGVTGTDRPATPP